MQQNEVKKNKTSIIIFVILILVIGGIVGYFIGTSVVEPKTAVNEVIKDGEKEEIKEEEKNEEESGDVISEGGAAVEELQEEKLAFNKVNDDKYVPFALMNIYDENMISGDKRNRSNILADNMVKFEFAYYTACLKYKDKTMDIEKEGYPEEMMDYNIGLEYNTLKKYYKELYGSDLDNIMLPVDFRLHDGYVYGVSVTGIMNYPVVEGYEFVKYGDVYFYRVKATVGEAQITYTIQFELEKKDGNYILKAITAY